MDPLLVANIFALLTAFGFAAGDTAVHSALRTSTPITGILTLSGVTLMIYGPIALFSYPLAGIGFQAFLLFLLGGIASPGLAGMLLYMSFRRLGLSRSVTIVSCAPLITVLFAIVALGERPGPLIYIGTVLIVGGVIVLARERQEVSVREGGGKSVWYYFVYVAIATIMFALAAIFRKVGLAIVPSLSVGLSISAIGSFLVVVIWHPFLPREDRFRIGPRDFWLFIVAGVLSSSGHLAFFAALKMGPLSTVAPLVYSAPLFALIFSWFLFRREERLTARVVWGALLICAGAALITMSRA